MIQETLDDFHLLPNQCLLVERKKDDRWPDDDTNSLTAQILEPWLYKTAIWTIRQWVTK